MERPAQVLIPNGRGSADECGSFEGWTDGEVFPELVEPGLARV